MTITENSGKTVSIFVEAHFRIEPSHEMLKALFDTIDPDLRTALDMLPPAKYTMRIKPREWKTDLQKFISFVYYVYTAWADEMP